MTLLRCLAGRTFALSTKRNGLGFFLQKPRPLGLFEGDEEVSGSFEGRGTGALPDTSITGLPEEGSVRSQKNQKKIFWLLDADAPAHRGTVQARLNEPAFSDPARLAPHRLHS